MKASVSPSGHLIVTHRSTTVRVLALAFVAGGIANWFFPFPTRTHLGWTALAAVFLLALIAADEWSEFDFDAAGGQLRWRREGWFRRDGGTISLSQITGLSLDRDFNLSSGTRGGARRLVVHTVAGPISVTTGYSGIGNAATVAGRAIQSYLGKGDTAHDISFTL